MAAAPRRVLDKAAHHEVAVAFPNGARPAGSLCLPVEITGGNLRHAAKPDLRARARVNESPW